VVIAQEGRHHRLARPLRPSERTFLIALSDAGAATLAVVLALWTWSLTAGFAFSPGFVARHGWWMLAVPLWTIALAPTRLHGAALDLKSVQRGVARACGLLLVAYLAVFFFNPDLLPRLVALYVLWNAAWLTYGGRLILLWMLTRAPFARRVLVVEGGPDSQVTADAARALLASDRLADVVLVDDVADATEVVVAVGGAVPQSTLDALLRHQERGLDVVTFAHLYEQTLRRVPVRHVGHDWMLTQLFAGAVSGDASPLAKRLLDVVAALVLGAAGLVFGALAAVAILLASGRPVLYSQSRVGRGGRVFRLTKFRTMHRDAEAQGPQWSPEHDPRITGVGRLLRRTHIDELPNLWAVLRGDMSMVGPRPERPEFVALLEHQVPLYRARLTVSPGLTGWAQVNAAYGDSVDDAVVKLEYDLYYVRHQSFWFDLTILARTAGRIAGWKGR
jgi:lipopolysaccharide/colanic/teichoic acid biosynthesis glycosyltransferase